MGTHVLSESYRCAVPSKASMGHAKKCTSNLGIPQSISGLDYFGTCHAQQHTSTRSGDRCICQASTNGVSSGRADGDRSNGILGALASRNGLPPSGNGVNNTTKGSAFQELDALSAQAHTRSDEMNKLVLSLYKQIQGLQQQNLGLLKQHQAELTIQQERLETDQVRQRKLEKLHRLSERRQQRVQELRRRDRKCQALMAGMQAKIDDLIEALSRKGASIARWGQDGSPSASWEEAQAAVKWLEDLLKGTDAGDPHRKGALPLAVNLLDSTSRDIQEKAALALLELVTVEERADDVACMEANRLGAGTRVTELLNSTPGGEVHPSMLPLWNVLTMAERRKEASGGGEELQAAAQQLEDLLKDPATDFTHRREALPLAVKLLDSDSRDMQEKAALTLLQLVTLNEQPDNLACMEANRLGAGSLVTELLQAPPGGKAHPSMLPLWNVLTISDMHMAGMG